MPAHTIRVAIMVMGTGFERPGFVNHMFRSSISIFWPRTFEGSRIGN